MCVSTLFLIYDCSSGGRGEQGPGAKRLNKLHREFLKTIFFGLFIVVYIYFYNRKRICLPIAFSTHSVINFISAGDNNSKICIYVVFWV